MEKLKSCPFCGGHVEIKRIGNEHTKKRSCEIKCPCGVKMVVAALRYSLDWCEEQMVKKWNKRW
jgi:hypothetical protein